MKDLEFYILGSISTMYFKDLFPNDDQYTDKKVLLPLLKKAYITSREIPNKSYREMFESIKMVDLQINLGC